jgi:hypothetical protein
VIRTPKKVEGDGERNSFTAGKNITIYANPITDSAAKSGTHVDWYFR